MVDVQPTAGAPVDRIIGPGDRLGREVFARTRPLMQRQPSVPGWIFTSW